MTGVFVADLSAYSDEELLRLRDKLSQDLEKDLLLHVNEGASEALRIERFFAYYLLSYTVKNVLRHSSMEKIKFESKKKPRFISSKIKFSVSHIKGAVAVIVSDESEVGIDIEAVSERSITVSDSFLKRYKVQLDSKLIKNAEKEEIITFIFSESSLSETKRIAKKEKTSIDDWTSTEAVVKLFGCGMSGISKFGEMLSMSNVYSARIELSGVEYSLSYAIKK